MLNFIAYSALFLVFTSTILALKGYYHLYWISALCIYIFSFIAGFTIGQLTVGLTLGFLFLAIAHSFRLIKAKWHSVVYGGAGLFAGFLMITFVDDYWLFYPFTFFR